MFRFPKSSTNQSPSKKVIGSSQKSQGSCKYPHRKCNLLCLENYEYCLKHILEDKSAPYRPCPFLYTVSGKKCGKPALKPDRKETWFCAEHNRKTNLVRQKASTRHAPPPTQEALLASLGHYARSSPLASSKKEESDAEDFSAKQPSQAINPFVEVDAAKVNSRSTQVLDYASDTDSDVEAAMLDSVWRSQDHESSDAESVDSQAEDPLKHAGVYTAEEVTVIMKDKMLRLQSLYIDQFRRLQHLLKERRRKYLHALKKEKETLSSIHDQEKTSAREQKLYQKLKALNHYHKYYGEEAILHKKALDRRAQVTEGHIARTSHKGKCAFTEGGVKCGVKTLPTTKYCQKHILVDTQQVLFRACGFKRDDHTCMEPTLNVFKNATCVYHITLPAQPHNTLEMCEAKETLKEEKSTNATTQKSTEKEATQTVASEPLKEEELKPSKLSVSEIKQEDSNSSKQALQGPDSITQQLAETVISEQTTLEVGNIEVVVPNSNDIVTTESNDKKMEVDSEVVNSPSVEPQKHESSDDLVMIDMITDVGVVEEVLESEVKHDDDDESMQLGQEHHVANE